MLFSSITFLIVFLPFFLLVYSLSPARFKNYVALAFSLLFYAWGGPNFIYVVVLNSIINYYLVGQLYISDSKRNKQLLLILNLVLNLGLLLYFKYANFFVENINILLNNDCQINLIKVALPIGISFYTFQTITYSVDIYRGVSKPLERVTDYLLYIVCFPQMIAGPIVRFNSIAAQLISRKETYNQKLDGFIRFTIGLSKKVLIANNIAVFANQIFELEATQLNTHTAWIGILCYTFQIYFDFSGYSDMAIGLGKMMGFTFPENFDNPYTSKNITEFWRRWHITLGEWMRDYLYIPLGGNRVKSEYRKYLNLTIVFLISGLWHGASWNFIIWGGYHGILLILDRLFLVKLLNKSGVLVSTIFTFFMVVVGWVFFRLDSFSDAIEYVNVLFSFDNQSISYYVNPNYIFWLMLSFTFSFFTMSKIGKSIMNIIYGYNENAQLLIPRLVIAIFFFFLCLSYLASESFNPFIYFKF